MLTGGAGADTFVFNLSASAGGLDRIADFQPKVDRIEIDASMFGGRLVAGAGVQFVSGPTPSSVGYVGGVFLYDDDSGLLSWDADGGGPGRAVAFAHLLDLPRLGAADFIVVA
jgi:Ca2+-binding RTX toxin-like protein